MIATACVWIGAGLALPDDGGDVSFERTPMVAAFVIDVYAWSVLLFVGSGL